MAAMISARRATRWSCPRVACARHLGRRFEACAAHEVPPELYAGRVVLINSVVQYFPQEQYLLDFLRAARTAGAVGVFVGDVRCAELLSFQRIAFKQNRAHPHVAAGF